ncbi:MAG TPA: flagellar protein FlgN [Chromatiales bacterium]|nr:flagellar protein FlgN [Chromatiales bacterium]
MPPSTAPGLLERLEAAVHTLQTALRAEGDALQDRAVEQVEAATAAKAEALAAVNDLTQELERAVRTTGLPLDGDGLRSFWARQAGTDGPTLETRWTSVCDTLRACERQNRLNGYLVERLSQGTRQALEILRGTPDGGPLYRPSGRLGPQPGGRDIGKA